MALSLDSSNQRRGRRRGRSRRALSEINVTPLVDVMLVLLIIFMISAPLLTAGVPIELPKTEAGAMQDVPDPITLSIRSDGRIYIAENEVPFANLSPRLKEMAADTTRPIYVRADGKASYETGGIMAQYWGKSFTLSQWYPEYNWVADHGPLNFERWVG